MYIARRKSSQFAPRDGDVYSRKCLWGFPLWARAPNHTLRHNHCQAFLYYHRFPQDHIFSKFAVGFLWLVQVFQVIASTIGVYEALFKVQMSTTAWYDTVYQISTVICSTIVQLYFVLRLYRFSGSIWLPVLLAILIPAQVGTGFAIWLKANITHGIETFWRTS
ncbi:uncharacterized protein EI90DRAFT_374744 [Cantharellus anzutake]|uniref:uncharacterized protein n=1 Tax=Cantharellus anzutake TaxID=1750568 RepID=UPI0019085238|nr:uncharacterized protein EI90DRAFT_374744 [Cantharellus anzutake]KAF8334911.1 hypothetical protein EI90DRAFT_374744 [Cantharellus anzutake]